METMTDTPETNEALAAILERDGELSEKNAPEVLVKLCRTIERERDEIRARLREEQQLHTLTLNERDEARDRLSAWKEARYESAMP
jgi:hypothetical protein